jgi:hypothetical protein
MLALSQSLKSGYRPSLKSLCDMLREFDANLKHDPLYLWLDNTPAVCADDIEKADWTAHEDGERSRDDSWIGRQDMAFGNDVLTAYGFPSIRGAA